MDALFVTWGALGAALGGLYVIAVLRWAPRPGRAFALGLVVAAAVYPLWALSAGAPWGWVGAELVGVALFGALALTALIGLAGGRALGALAVGWALHPLWDLALHASAVGGLPDAAGAAHVPAWYPPACATFDWAVALAVAGMAYRGRGPAPGREADGASVA